MRAEKVNTMRTTWIVLSALWLAFGVVPVHAVASAEPEAQQEDGGWSMAHAPGAGAPTSRLTGVACVSPSDCWAVGRSDSGSADRTLIEHWDGATWTVAPSPNASRTKDELAGVACVSANDCWAVGDTFNNTNGAYETLILHWDGATWSIVPSPNQASMFNFLRSVSCVSATACWAVGDYYKYNPATGGNVSQTLIEHWDGTSWKVLPSPNGGDASHNFLTGVSCVSTSECFAVGTYMGESAYQTLITRWDGVSWKLVSSPGRSNTDDHQWTGVSCLSTSHCYAVGFAASPADSSQSWYRTLVGRWDGRTWSLVPSPNASTTLHNELNAVACRSDSDCWAVGTYGSNASGRDTLVERWDGTSWTVVESPNTVSARSDRLLGVSCAAAADCMAVGFDEGGGTTHTLAERWNGTAWSIENSPDGPADPPLDSPLHGVACASSSLCWAVGSQRQDGIDRTLVERWNGSAWSVFRSPDIEPGGALRDNVLNDVTCASASACWAVGRYRGDLGAQTLIERWDGISWSVASSPNPVVATEASLAGVTCVSPTDCWAVGSSSVGGVIHQTLIERWDGTTWTVAPSPNALGATSNRLRDVTCASATNCWAVGSSSTAGVGGQTLVERWNGTSWTLVDAPEPAGATSSSLMGVACAAAADCWAVGTASDGTATRTLIEHWDGSSWTIVESPQGAGAADSVLASVSCASSTECWAVGHRAASASDETLVARWGGSSWAIVQSPNAAGASNSLDSVTCTGASGCWAVGSSRTDTVAQPLVLTRGS